MVTFCKAHMHTILKVNAYLTVVPQGNHLWNCATKCYVFPDIVKLNTCILFYDYFHHDKFPNLPVSLVSELHNYSTRSASSNQVAIPSFQINLRRFRPSIIGSFFWNDIAQSIRDKPSKKMFSKALIRWYLA